MGEVRVPVNALYSAQTQRAVENFPISGMTLESAHIAALARIKKAAATTNAELGVLDADLARAIEEAADLVAAGDFDGDFPIDVFQTGSGTSSNMNMNEVLATLANKRPACCRLREDCSPERPRQRLTVLQRRVPHLGPRGRHLGPDQRPDPGTGPPGRVPGAQGSRIRHSGEVRPHPLDGCHPRHAWARNLAATQPRSATALSASSPLSPASPRSPWAAPPLARASTPRPASRSA